VQGRPPRHRGRSSLPEPFSPATTLASRHDDKAGCRHDWVRRQPGGGDAHRRVFFVSVVEEENFLAAESPGEKRIPKLPDGLANQTDGEKAINDWHGKKLGQTLSDANLVLALVGRQEVERGSSSATAIGQPLSA